MNQTRYIEEVQARERNSFCSSLSKMFYHELTATLYERADQLLSTSYLPVDMDDIEDAQALVNECVNSPEATVLIAEGIHTLSDKLMQLSMEIEPGETEKYYDFIPFEVFNKQKREELLERFDDVLFSTMMTKWLDKSK